MPDRGLQRFGRPGGLKEVVAPPNTGGELTRAETVTAIRETLIRCVEGQMMGDVPVGVFLSGGLDSSLVAAIAARWARERGYTLHTFAVGLTGASDLQAARDVSRHLGTEHHEVVYTTDEALDALPEVIRSIEHFDPELVRSAVPNYLLAACAVRHVKVVLTGEGADELFAGYDYLTEIQDHHALQSELQRTVDGLHNLNLQRCDRVTMAHGLEARVPFLDPQMIALALSIPAAWKLHQPGTCEKQPVREAFDGWLPDGVLWRKKEQFGEGSGATALLRGRTRGEGHTEPTGNCEMTLRTAEEASYHRIWEDAYRGVRPGDTISRSVTV
jgi:asparagine synthase (glutamine-hydrolysing)